MTRDELLIHGFKRVMEALTSILEAGNTIISLLKEADYKLGVIQEHVASIDEKTLHFSGSIERIEDEVKRIQSNTFLTATKRGNDE